MFSNIFAGILLALGTLFLGFFVDRGVFWEVLGGFILAFTGYLWLVRCQFTSPSNPSFFQSFNPAILPSALTNISDQRSSTLGSLLSFLLVVGLALRLFLLFAFPLLSDDIYRFLWDGYLLNAGISPFSELPAHYLEAGNGVPGLSQQLFEKLNSPEYYTIYPPVAQGVFTFATALAGENWWLGGVLMKLFLFAGECGTIWLLLRMLPAWGLPKSSALLYWLNPLILVEICGNLHFEGLMVFFLLLALWLLSRRKIVYGALAFALSVAAKLLPLMLLPFLIVRLWRGKYGRDFWLFSLVFGLSLLVMFLPLIDLEFIRNFGSSLDLYFRKFEFNASLYYLLRTYGYYEIGWNQIARFGPLLGKVAGALILLLAAAEGYLWLQSSKAQSDREHEASGLEPNHSKVPGLRDGSTEPLPASYLNLPFWWMLAFSIYLFCATTVHPWYLSIPILLSCFTHLRYPIVWSFLIVLTYASYTTVPYQENLWLVGVEYLVVYTLLAVELWRIKSPAKALRSC
ncbi:hypothetical protein CEQ90_15140 [Lewinellaceae bacterium SD302]|nr:hypothetical protein CEQ90_15140 [Lewinellaceae bacterium SD302]